MRCNGCSFDIKNLSDTGMPYLALCKYDLIPAIAENKDATFTHTRINFIQLAEAFRTCTMKFQGNSGRLSVGQ